MRAHPCPYASVDDLKKRRRQLRGLAGCQGAATDKPDDAAFVARWQKLYAEAQAKKPSSVEDDEDGGEIRILDRLDELFPED